MRPGHVNPKKGRTEDKRLARVREALERKAAKQKTKSIEETK